MNKDAEKIFTTGLLNGFAGETKLTEADRNGFPFMTSFYEGPEGTYLDGWTQVGGQEVVRPKNGQLYTRLYGGGVASEETLSSLGLSEKDIVGPNGVLVFFLKKLEGGTRLTEDVCLTDGKFSYKYEILDKDLEGEAMAAKESITYDEKATVFVHYFIFSPAK